MNNLGMNPMGMNPMQMNNMGMNNQSNLMDLTALNDKNIIQQYENKIRELEEIIRQKDFENTVLKIKLNNKIFGSFSMSMNPNMNKPNNDNEIFIILESYIKLNKNDKASVLNDYSQFTHNYMPILFDKTFEENGIQNGSKIDITDKIYNLEFKYNNNSTTISLDGNCSLKQAIYLYCQLCTDNSIYGKVMSGRIKFVRNQIELFAYDQTPLKQIFGKDEVNQSILVLDQTYLMG